jgi:hypothetical protein
MNSPVNPNPPGPDADAILERLRPVLELIFEDFGIPPEKAERIVEESCRVLAGKRLTRQNPALWLLHNIVERCERSGEEEGLEDPPA